MLLIPTMAIEPPVAGEVLAASHADPALPAMGVIAMAALNAPFNMSGQPGISLPLHQTPAGLPIGVQLVGRPWAEAQLIQVASQVEAAAPWHGRVAPIHA